MIARPAVRLAFHIPRSHKPVLEKLESRCLMSAAIPTITQTNFVSDNPLIPAAHVDTNLVNPWGIAITRTGNVWIADNGSGLTTLYDQAGNGSPSVVTIPAPASGDGSAPTGEVLNTGRGFKVSANGLTGASEYIFSTEDGTISGWSPSVDATHAVLEVDHSGTGDVFKGLAITGVGKGARIYATDFHNNRVEVFNSSFQPVMLKAGAFTDSTLPAGFAPFGIQTIRGRIYVSYALQDDIAHDDVAGAGNGFVDAYNLNGKLLRRIASTGTLNSPWAMMVAPAGFGKYSADLLVGDFGDGRINVFNNRNTFVGQLADGNNTAISIEGLWGLTVGVKAARRTIFFTAGPNSEADGLFGTLTATLPKIKPGKVGNPPPFYG